MNKIVNPRIGIFIVAYNASKTILQVLDRIPEDVWERIEEVFIFDDSSQDNTSQVVSQFLADGEAESSRIQKIKIFYNEVNLGYGGNQKRGYLYAQKRGLDFVVLLHGDGQYAPEVMGDLLSPLVAGKADAVFGSRMMMSGAALRGGMPFYKYLGNRILSTFQNFMLGRKFHEYHSGYRAYSVKSLKHLPLLKNSNDFHFDTEIIIQLLEGGFRIKEVPIPTYYGDEICHVNGIQYAWNVALATMGYRLHKMGLYYSGCFDLGSGKRYTAKKNRYSSHRQIPDLVSPCESSHGQALDIGCGSGYLAEKLVEKGYEVVGVDLYDSEAARQVCRKFIVCDVDSGITVNEEGAFDYIVLADVVEHVRDPERLVRWTRSQLVDGGRVIASTGNVAHFFVRLMLLFGRFTYTERGILDRTHVRLFTLDGFRYLFESAGFKLRTERYCPIPFENLWPGVPWLTDLLSLINQYLCRLWPSLFAYQIIVEAEVDESSVTEVLRSEQILAPYEQWVS